MMLDAPMLNVRLENTRQVMNIYRLHHPTTSSPEHLLEVFKDNSDLDMVIEVLNEEKFKAFMAKNHAGTLYETAADLALDVIDLEVQSELQMLGLLPESEIIKDNPISNQMKDSLYLVIEKAYNDWHEAYLKEIYATRNEVKGNG